MELTEWSWQGYGRKHGAPGIRNRVLVIYTVKCSEFVARRIVEESGHPDVELVGFDGCTDNQYAVDLLISLIKHPNVGAVLTVGLGCEYIQPQWLADVAVKECKEASWMFIQQEGGTKPTVTKGTAWVRETLERLKHTPRVRMGFKDLVIGAECGGSDYTSGLAGNVVVGRFFDRLVDLGGCAIFEEIVEAIGLISCGAHIVFLVTGRGNVVGSAVTPCIKITGNHETFSRMEEDMDFDASPILYGGMSQKEMALDLAAYVAGTAGGTPTKSEVLGHKEFYIPYKYQEKEVAYKRACEGSV